MMKVGDVAPEFSAIDQDGATVSLADLRGKSSVVLFFYPKDGSPICTKEACSFRDSYEEFTRVGAEVIGVSGDSTETHRRFIAQHRLPFRLLSDRDGKLRDAYAAPKTLGLLPGRTTYVIDKDGIIRLIFSAQFAHDRHVAEALRILS